MFALFFVFLIQEFLTLPNYKLLFVLLQVYKEGICIGIFHFRFQVLAPTFTVKFFTLLT